MKIVKRESVNRELIDQWVKGAYPNGLYKLSEKAQIPVYSLSKIRLGTWIPKNPAKREALAEALGVTEAELFPSRAS